MINCLVDLFENWFGWTLGSPHIFGRYLVTPRHNAFAFRRELRRDIHRRIRYSVEHEILKPGNRGQ